MLVYVVNEIDYELDSIGITDVYAIFDNKKKAKKCVKQLNKTLKSREYFWTIYRLEK